MADQIALLRRRLRLRRPLICPFGNVCAGGRRGRGGVHVGDGLLLSGGERRGVWSAGAGDLRSKPRAPLHRLAIANAAFFIAYGHCIQYLYTILLFSALIAQCTHVSSVLLCLHGTQSLSPIKEFSLAR